MRKWMVLTLAALLRVPVRIERRMTFNVPGEWADGDAVSFKAGAPTQIMVSGEWYDWPGPDA